MKIGIISDIHSNIEAFIEVINYMRSNDVDKIICLGDIIGIGPYPEKCIEYIIKNRDYFLSCVKGNHENYLLNGISRHNHKDSKPMSDELFMMHVHNHGRIDKKQKEFLNRLKNKDVLYIEKRKIIVEHYHMNEQGEFKKFIKNPTIKEIQELYNDQQADIYLFGHTHKKYYAKINNQFWINPGSVGCPKDTNCANCGILEITNDMVDYKQIEVKYNIKNVIDSLSRLDYSELDLIIKNYL